MAVAVSPANTGKLQAKAPKPKTAAPIAAKPFRARIAERHARFRETAQPRVRRYAISSARRTQAAAGRSAPARSGRQVFGIITGAALMGLVVMRGEAVGALLAHMANFWRGVITLGSPGKNGTASTRR